MLLNLKNLSGPPEENLISQTAQVLELAFRKQMEVQGFPEFTQLRCRLVAKKELRADLVELVEECLFPDGGASRKSLHAQKHDSGWHIVILPK